MRASVLNPLARFRQIFFHTHYAGLRGRWPIFRPPNPAFDLLSAPKPRSTIVVLVLLPLVLVLVLVLALRLGLLGTAPTPPCRCQNDRPAVTI
jgi:hypothetical protein